MSHPRDYVIQKFVKEQLEVEKQLWQNMIAATILRIWSQLFDVVFAKGSHGEFGNLKKEYQRTGLLNACISKPLTMLLMINCLIGKITITIIIRKQNK